MKNPSLIAKTLTSLRSWFHRVMLGKSRITPCNRRRNPRLKMCLPVICKLGTCDYPANLLDLSADGMRLELTRPLRVGQEVKVSSLPGSPLCGRQLLTCRTAWVGRDHQVGLVYCESPRKLAQSWIHRVLRNLDCDRVRRRTRRIECRLHVRLMPLDGRSPVNGICLNLSAGGCLVQLRENVTVGETVTLGLGSGPNDFHAVLQARVLKRARTSDPHKVLYHLQFWGAGQRANPRLHSLVLSLIAPGSEAGDEPELDLEQQHFYSQQFEPVEVLRRARVVPPRQTTVVATRSQQMACPALSQKIKAPTGTCLPREVVARCPSLWMARALPVSLTRRPFPAP